jgi:hypothetical protein
MDVNDSAKERAVGIKDSQVSDRRSENLAIEQHRPRSLYLFLAIFFVGCIGSNPH